MRSSLDNMGDNEELQNAQLRPNRHAIEDGIPGYPAITPVEDAALTQLFVAFHPGATQVTLEMKLNLMQEIYRN